MWKCIGPTRSRRESSSAWHSRVYFSTIRAMHFLDEATSALDVPNERLMYELLSRKGIRFLSSGHRPTLRKFHRNILQLSPHQTWKLERSSEFEALTSAA
jgi:ABC-type uncharacterized transport system fused permease/ATPase subunit